MRDHGFSVVLAWLLAACAGATATNGPPASLEASGSTAFLALAGAPWDRDTKGLGALCNVSRPCDTIFVDPRVVQLREGSSAFLFPDHSEAAFVLTVKDLSRAQLTGHALRLQSFEHCLERRERPSWQTEHSACVAIGIFENPDSAAAQVRYWFNVLSPAQGLAWPFVTLMREPEGWIPRLVSYSYE